MFDWRSRALKVVLLVLHGIIAEKPNEKQRSQNMAKIRAAEQLGRLFEKMGAMRVDVPVVCPHCGQEHLVP